MTGECDNCGRVTELRSMVCSTGETDQCADGCPDIAPKADAIAAGLLRLVEIRRRIKEIDEELYRLDPSRGKPL